MGYGITILVEGPRACFTRPEMKAERVSYDVITPSAARGIIEAIYWKPAIRWQIDSIEVLNKIRFDTFRRNEVEGKLSYRAQKDAFNKGTPIALDATSQRQQRATLYLRDVAYVIRAHFEMTSNAGLEDTPEKHYNIALRRLRKGQHFCQPVLGAGSSLPRFLSLRATQKLRHRGMRTRVSTTWVTCSMTSISPTPNRRCPCSSMRSCTTALSTSHPLEMR